MGSFTELYFLSPFVSAPRVQASTITSTEPEHEQLPHKKNKKELFDLGNKCFSVKDYANAEKYYLQALQQDAVNVVLLGNLSAAQTKQDKFESARRSAEQAIRLKPVWAKGRFRLAQALHGLRDERGAIKAAYQAYRLDEREKSYLDFFNALKETIHLGDSLEELLSSAAAEVQTLMSPSKTTLQPPNQPRRLPVTVLSGFLGAGKTTLLKRILTQSDLKIAVLVNDITDVSIDAQVLRNATIHSVNGKPSLIELSNGCICCTLRDDLLNEVMKIAANPAFDYLVIESTGISEPMPVALTFTMEDVPSGMMLPSVARLDTMVTMVDLSQFESLTSTSKRLKDVGMETTPQDERTLADLLVDQLEFADVIILNKMDLVESETKLNQIESTIRALNPVARMYKTHHCQEIPLGAVLNTHLFNMERASNSAGWKQELLFPHKSETLEYGFSSFTYRGPNSSIAFDGHRVTSLFFRSASDDESLLNKYGVIRSKGFFWVAQDDRIVLEWASAGPNYSCKCAGFWTCAVDNDDGAKPDDHKIEIVFIGINLKRDELCQALDDCLNRDVPYTRNPTKDALGEVLYDKGGFGSLYELMGSERQFDSKTLKKEQTRLDQIRARLELFSNLERDLTPKEIIEAKQLAAEYKSLRDQ